MRLVLLMVCVALTSGLLEAQASPSTVDSVMRILAVGHADVTWTIRSGARLAVVLFGSDAGEVATAPLQRADVDALPWRYLVGFVEISSYTASGVPASVLRGVLTRHRAGSTGAVGNESLRGLVFGSLAARPDGLSEPEWREHLDDVSWMVRQAAISGLACVSGARALEYIRPHLSDASEVVRQVADFYVSRLAAEGDAARVCGHGSLTRLEAEQPRLVAGPELARQVERRFGIRIQK